MTDSEFEQAMMATEFVCEKCGARMVLCSTMSPTRCSVCRSRRLRMITGESIRYYDYWRRMELVLRTLTYREREILKLRYGFIDNIYIQEGIYVYTQEETGRIFKISQQYISEIEGKAIERLCHKRRIQKLREVGLLSSFAMHRMPLGLARLVSRIVRKVA